MLNPRLLLAIFDSIYVGALAAWVGAILFFSFGVAPIIFRVLGPEAAAKFVRALFPRYYAWGVGATAVALPALVCGPLTYPELRGGNIGVQAVLIIAGLFIMLYCGNSLTPAINAARDAGPDQATRFDRLHKRSVQLNGVALVLGLILLVGFAIRRPTQTTGLKEMTPTERVAYDNDFSRAFDDIVRGHSTRSSSGTSQEPASLQFDEAARKELEGLIEARRKRNPPPRFDVETGKVITP